MKGKSDQTCRAEISHRFKPFYSDRELKQLVQMIDNTDHKHSPHLQAVIPPREQNQ